LLRLVEVIILFLLYCYIVNVCSERGQNIVFENF